MKYSIRQFSPIWWAIVVVKASLFIGLFLLIMNYVGYAV